MEKCRQRGRARPFEVKKSKIVPTEFVLFIPAHRDYDTKVQILYMGKAGVDMRRFVLILIITLFAVPATLWAVNDPIRVEQGQLSGTTGKNSEVRVYKGIPYAAPPVGDLRWKPPQPAASWQGVREAKEFGNACWQTPYAANSFYQAKLPPLSEDCLTLNVWTAA